MKIQFRLYLNKKICFCRTFAGNMKYQKWIIFFVSEFQYTEECIPEYLKRWWRENLIVSYILTALVFLYFFLMLIIRRNLVYLFLELLPILLLLLIRVKVSRAIKIEKKDIR